MLLLLSLMGGLLLGTLAWWSHVTLILFQTHAEWSVLLFGGIGLALGFMLIPLLPIRNRFFLTLLSVFITTVAIYVPIYANYQNYLLTFNSQQPAQALLYFQVDNPDHVWLIGLPFALSLGIIAQIPLLFDTTPNKPTTE
jgi:hypothetical protein